MLGGFFQASSNWDSNFCAAWWFFQAFPLGIPILHRFQRLPSCFVGIVWVVFPGFFLVGIPTVTRTAPNWFADVCINNILHMVDYISGFCKMELAEIWLKYDIFQRCFFFRLVFTDVCRNHRKFHVIAGIPFLWIKFPGQIRKNIFLNHIFGGGCFFQVDLICL